MPASIQIYMGLEKDTCNQLPLTVPDARGWLSDYDRKFREDGGNPVVPKIQNRGADEDVNGSGNQADNAAVDKGDKKRGAVNGQKMPDAERNILWCAAWMRSVSGTRETQGMYSDR